MSDSHYKKNEEHIGNLIFTMSNHDNKTGVKTEDSSQIDPKNEGSIEKYRGKPLKFVIRPNNYWLRVNILPDSPKFHIAETKIKGRNTPFEVVRQSDVTIEKISNKCVLIHLRKRFKKVIQSEKGYDKLYEGIKEFLVAKLLEFMQKYPEAKLDWSKARIVKQEDEIKDRQMKLPRNLRMHDTNFKKVYSNTGFEMVNSPIAVKNFINNRVLENMTPELLKEIRDMKGMLGGMVEQQTAISNSMMLQSSILKRMVKPSIIERIGNFIKKLRRIDKNSHT